MRGLCGGTLLASERFDYDFPSTALARSLQRNHHRMPNLLAMSFEGELAPSFDLRCLEPGRTLPDGWGIGYYPGGEPRRRCSRSRRRRRAASAASSCKAWEHLESSLFVLHIRTATWGSISDANTQPFCRSWGGRDWLIAHAGSLAAPARAGRRSALRARRLDRHRARSSASCCRWSPSRAGAASATSIPTMLRGGSTSSTSTAADHVSSPTAAISCVYADRDGAGDVYLWAGAAAVRAPRLRRRRPGGRSHAARREEPQGRHHLLRAARARTRRRAAGEPGRQLGRRARLSWCGEGARCARSTPARRDRRERRGGADAAAVAAPVAPARRAPRRGRFDVAHRTVYRYAEPGRAQHAPAAADAGARPPADACSSTSSTLSVEGQQRDYEDVFGNRVRAAARSRRRSPSWSSRRARASSCSTPIRSASARCAPARPSRSCGCRGSASARSRSCCRRSCPRRELAELAEYAMSFVERNDYDLLDTLLDINATIFRRVRVPARASTTVLHDAVRRLREPPRRLPGLHEPLHLPGAPARRAGALRVRLHLHGARSTRTSGRARRRTPGCRSTCPRSGWKGFDPTNGILTQTDHVRVAVGRNYVDATPTSGTIFVGGGGETLEVEVRVDRIA